MEHKEIKITVPEGYEIDKENSTFERIIFKQKRMSYEDVAEALFRGKEGYFISDRGGIRSADFTGSTSLCDPNNAPTRRQLEKVLAYNKLLNVAYYFNSKHAPSDSVLYYISLQKFTGELLVASKTGVYQNCDVLFNVRDDAKNAIEILGEHVVKTALGVFE